MKKQTITIEVPASKRNGIAAALSDPCFRVRKVRSKAGRGSYTRKGRANVRGASPD